MSGIGLVFILLLILLPILGLIEIPVRSRFRRQGPEKVRDDRY